MHVVAPSTHYSILVACDDAHYLKPEYRKGWTGIRMIRAAEEMLRDLGVKTISYHQKTRPDIDKGAVFERLGYELTERIYMKVL
jgi:GNAT superfamily N-acetyltransferase